ncbi:hypothetical protein K440DRAFT_644007 [Wilcoxina mikolae CBS 423.85]|nr:hypothetical protein K440DRAFT_644007 [Wilcoxina mikolae CBS 423.85]
MPVIRATRRLGWCFHGGCFAPRETLQDFTGSFGVTLHWLSENTHMQPKPTEPWPEIKNECPEIYGFLELEEARREVLLESEEQPHQMQQPRVQRQQAPEEQFHRMQTSRVLQQHQAQQQKAQQARTQQRTY